MKCGQSLSYSAIVLPALQDSSARVLPTTAIVQYVMRNVEHMDDTYLHCIPFCLVSVVHTIIHVSLCVQYEVTMRSVRDSFSLASDTVKLDAESCVENAESSIQFSLTGSIQKLGTTSSMNVAMSPSGSLTLDLALGKMGTA